MHCKIFDVKIMFVKDVNPYFTIPQITVIPAYNTILDTPLPFSLVTQLLD